MARDLGDADFAARCERVAESGSQLITERKMAEEALRQSEAKYRRLFESTQTAMEVISMETGLVVLVRVRRGCGYSVNRGATGPPG